MISLNPSLPQGEGHAFSRVPQANIERSTFDRSTNWKGTMNAGYLYPVYMDEMLPGDTFECKTSHVIRMQPSVVPLMDNLTLDMHYWFVPNRILWENWDRMMGERRPTPTSSINYTTPIITWLNADGAIGTDSLYGNLGIPPITPTVSLSWSALPLRAYNKTWNEWYRDENLQDMVADNVDDGPDARTDYALLKRNKRHDYFTSCLPWAQRGDAVSLPLGTSAPVNLVPHTTSTNPMTIENASTGVDFGSGAGVNVDTLGRLADDAVTVNGVIDPNGRLVTDLSTATAATINSFREALMTQELLERDARGGTRLTEIIRAHFGVVSPDARLQRPEFLGSFSESVNSHVVPQTSEATAGNPLGGLAAFSTAVGAHRGFTYSATEHGFVFALASIRADLNYQQGLRKMWSRQTRYDYYLPALAHLGEQPVPNKEIYAIGDSGTQDDATFGYQEAWADYRYLPNIITGEMNSADASSLDSYHLAQDFAALPVLNSSFVEEDPPMSRNLAVTTQDQFICDFYHNLRCTRPLPLFSVPGLGTRL